jgi:phenylacetate-CoA ligase
MQTSGSSSEPLRFLLERGRTRCKETAYIDSFNRRLSLPRGCATLSLRGRNVRGSERGTTRSFDPIKRMLAISPNHLTDALMPGHVAAARRHRVASIQGYPSAVYILARWLAQNAPGSSFAAGIRGVQLFSETVEPFMLDTIRAVFDCPVLLHYGHSERAAMAASMPDDPRYFVWPLYGKVELVDGEGRAIDEPGQAGEIVVTGFDNRVMPFVRYRTGDIARWSAGPAHPALPGFPVLERIDGRDSDFIFGRDGRAIPMTSVGGLRPPVFTRVEAVQYEQFEPGRLIVCLQTGGGLARDTRRELQQFFEAKFQGMVEAELREVTQMARTANGKLRTIVQHCGEALHA